MSSLTFSWLTPLLKAGFTGSLSKDQVPVLPDADRVDNVNRDFERCDFGLHDLLWHMVFHHTLLFT